MEMAIIGLLAGMLTTGAQIPQAYKIYRTGSTGDLSRLWISILFVGTLVWLYYGIVLNDLPLIIWNSTSTLILGYIAAYKFNIIKTKTESTLSEKPLKIFME
jgi:MtN3 and saliva related transmembrane protein